MRKFITAAALGAIGLVGCESEGGGADEAADEKYAAFGICGEFVKDRLRSPGSAKFRNFFEDDGEVVVTGAEGGPYTVRSSVDSENGFGALLRTEFTCVVRPTGDNMWQLVDLRFDE